MELVIPHHVEGVIGGKPLVNGSLFPEVDFRVDVPGHETIDLRVHQGQITPLAGIQLNKVECASVGLLPFFG